MKVRNSLRVARRFLFYHGSRGRNLPRYHKFLVIVVDPLLLQTRTSRLQISHGDLIPRILITSYPSSVHLFAR